MIGVALSIPELDPLTKPVRDKHDKHRHIEPHLTVYHSNFTHSLNEKHLRNLLKLIEELKTHPRKVVIDAVVKQHHFVYLRVQNGSTFSTLKNHIVDTFGKEKKTHPFHISLGYRVNDADFGAITRHFDAHLPITVSGTAFKIVMMNVIHGTLHAEEYYV